MDYWYDIIENYDPTKIKGSESKDHGTFSQKATVILLIYLAFGTDYPTGIAEYFNELKDRLFNCPSVLTNANKIGSVLKRMNDDKLVILLKKVSVGAAPRLYYVINPQILKSPIRDSATYIKRDGSPFKIPLDTIEDFLKWLAMEQAGTTDMRQEELLRQERHERTDEILSSLLDPIITPNYFAFLFLIEAEAALWDLQRESRNQQPILDSLIIDYIHEFMDTGPKFSHFVEPNTKVEGIREPIALGWLRQCERWERSKKRSTWVNPSLIDVFPNQIYETK